MDGRNNTETRKVRELAIQPYRDYSPQSYRQSASIPTFVFIREAQTYRKETLVSSEYESLEEVEKAPKIILDF